MPEESELITFRKSFPELDESLSDQEIKYGFSLCDDLEITERNQRILAAAHFALEEIKTDLSATTLEVEVGGIRRRYLTAARRGELSAYWSGTVYGRRFMVLVRSKKQIRVFEVA